MKRDLSFVVVVALLTSPGSQAAGVVSHTSFDHSYAAYARLLGKYVRGAEVDYAALAADRASLQEVVASFGGEDTRGEPAWTREERMAFWINAYNALTLDAIVAHYPIRSRLFTLQPRNSIRQIDGVWTVLTWNAAGRAVTLDDIEHRILRPVFGDARVHFAINCASQSCPPLAEAPYRAEALDAQLDAAGRRFLQSAEGARARGDRLHVSSIFKWYGSDFIAQFAGAGGARPPVERAILAVVRRYGSADAAELAGHPAARLSFLDYDWSLNDIVRR